MFWQDVSSEKITFWTTKTQTNKQIISWMTKERIVCLTISNEKVTLVVSNNRELSMRFVSQ